MPLQLLLIKPDEPGVQYRADARLRLWGTAICALTAVALTAAGYEGRLKPLLAGPLAAAFLIWSAYLLVTFLGQGAERYTLTSGRLEVERGVLSKRYESIELWRVREVVLEQTLGERLRGAGRITLMGSDAAQVSLTIGPVAKARAFYGLLVAATPKPPAQANALR
jgi:uncharacterized membrane protein YdbT with pleckstrin-like domain